MKAYQQFIDVLDLLSAAETPLSLTEVMKALNYSKSTTHRALTFLEDSHILVKFDKKYTIGPKVLNWSNNYLNRNVLIADYRNKIIELSKRFNLTTNLYEYLKGELICIDKIEPEKSLCYRSRIGYSTNLYSTAAGKAILSKLSHKEKEYYFKKTELKPFTPKTTTSLEELKDQLLKYNKLGYAFEFEENHEGFVCIGVAIMMGNTPIGAISMSTLIYTCTDKQLTEYGEALVEVERSVN